MTLLLIITMALIYVFCFDETLPETAERLSKEKAEYIRNLRWGKYTNKEFNKKKDDQQ